MSEITATQFLCQYRHDQNKAFVEALVDTQRLWNREIERGLALEIQRDEALALVRDALSKVWDYRHWCRDDELDWIGDWCERARALLGDGAA